MYVMTSGIISDSQTTKEITVVNKAKRVTGRGIDRYAASCSYC